MTITKDNNGTKPYKWTINILVGLLLALTGFFTGNQIVTSDVRENVRRIDRNELHIEQINANIVELKSTMDKQNTKLDDIYKLIQIQESRR